MPTPIAASAIPFFSDAEVRQAITSVDNMLEFPTLEPQLVGAKRKLFE